LIPDACFYLFTRESFKGSKWSKPTNVEFYFELQEATSTGEKCFIRFKVNSYHFGTPEASALVTTALGQLHALFWNVNPALSCITKGVNIDDGLAAVFQQFGATPQKEFALTNMEFKSRISLVFCLALRPDVRIFTLDAVPLSKVSEAHFKACNKPTIKAGFQLSNRTILSPFASSSVCYAGATFKGK
jgi:hypothetical protein